MKNSLDRQVPTHVSIIMDGNGRWAKARHMPRLEGHRQGAKTVRMVVEESRRLGIRYLSLYAFSTENWQRPKEEVWGLMKLFERYLRTELDLLKKNGIRLRVIGNRSRLPQEVLEAVEFAESETRSAEGMDLILAISYGGREEIVQAARSLAEKIEAGNLSSKEINESHIQQALYAPDVPDPDLLIRTSDEFRISNFLLWQLAYSEIVVTSVSWPEFKKESYLECLKEYASRSRRYGLTADQVNGHSSAGSVH